MFRRKRKREQMPQHHAQWVMAQPDPARAIVDYAIRSGCGFYLGPEAPPDGSGFQLRFGWPQNALLVLGPPREGKTSALVIPIVCSCPGPVVTTSTKPDVFEATAMVRALRGRVWVYDPMGTESVPPGALDLRWSPVAGAVRWDDALKMATIMVETARPSEGTRNSSFWETRGAKLLAALLHLAARKGLSIRQVKQWIAQRQPGELMVTAEGRIEGDQLWRSDLVSTDCLETLGAMMGTAPEEASGVWSTCDTILAAYSFEGAQRSCDPPYNFDPATFVVSSDTVYIMAGSRDQRLVAPLVVGLLDAIVEATYRQTRARRLGYPVNFVLDEAANIAPIPTLPQLASEGGGQGLQIAAFFQDFSQPHKRWGEEAKGFWTLFGEKLVLPGIAHKETVELISLLVGDYDRPIETFSENEGGNRWGGVSHGRSETIQRWRILPESAIASGPAPGGSPVRQAWHIAKYIEPHTVESVFVAPWYGTPPWPAVVASALHQYQCPDLPIPPLDPNALFNMGWSAQFCERFERDRQSCFTHPRLPWTDSGELGLLLPGSGLPPMAEPPTERSSTEQPAVDAPVTPPPPVRDDRAGVREDRGTIRLPPNMDDSQASRSPEPRPPQLPPAGISPEQALSRGQADQTQVRDNDKEDDLASL